MEPALLLLIAEHFTGEATWTIPSFYYVTLANNGTEVTGVTRQPVLYTHEVVSATEMVLKNADAAAVPTANSGTADEAWVYDAVSGGNRLLRCPFGAPITLTAGGTKTFAVGDLTTTIDNTTPAAP